MLRNKVPYLTQGIIRKKVLEFSAIHARARTIPVDIEGIIEELGIEIVPEYGCNSAGFNAYISADFKSIVIDADEYKDDKKYTWVRFTLAHEIGHLVLHREFLASLGGTMDLCALSTELDESQYGWLESHANVFARALLVPAAGIAAEYRARRPTVYSLARMYDVSHKIIEKRMCEDDVAELIADVI